MAIRDVVTMGYGNGTFSPGVSKLPVLGYAIGGAAPAVVSSFIVRQAMMLIMLRGKRSNKG